MAHLASPARRLKRPYPTLQGQDVYVSCPRRIRFERETYTFSSQNVYVLLVIRIRPDQAGYTLQAKGVVTLVSVVLVEMKTRLERTGGSRWSLKHSELGVPEVVKRPQRIAFSQIPDRE